MNVARFGMPSEMEQLRYGDWVRIDDYEEKYREAEELVDELKDLQERFEALEKTYNELLEQEV